MCMYVCVSGGLRVSKQRKESGHARATSGQRNWILRDVIETRQGYDMIHPNTFSGYTAGGDYQVPHKPVAFHQKQNEQNMDFYCAWQA